MRSELGIKVAYVCTVRMLNHQEKIAMFSWAIAFFLIALVAAFFGFAGIAASAAGIAKIVFVVALILAIVSLVAGRRPAR